jgi:hypothetical protein
MSQEQEGVAQGEQTLEERIQAEHEWFKKVFEGVKYCFCNKCKHSEDYGPCDQCWCKNKSAVARKEAKDG